MQQMIQQKKLLHKPVTSIQESFYLFKYISVLYHNRPIAYMLSALNFK